MGKAIVDRWIPSTCVNLNRTLSIRSGLIGSNLVISGGEITSSGRVDWEILIAAEMPAVVFL